MNDASGENIDEHITAAEKKGTKLPKDNGHDLDADHLDPRCAYVLFPLHWGLFLLDSIGFSSPEGYLH